MSPDYFQIIHNKKSENWNLETGYDKTIPIDTQTYPYRVLGSGIGSGIVMHLKLYEQHLDYACRGPVQGYRVVLHTPGELPQVSQVLLQDVEHVEISVKPSMTTTATEGLKDYDPNR